jgi:hypothetical protein
MKFVLWEVILGIVISRKVLYFTAGFSLLIGALIAPEALTIFTYTVVVFIALTSTLMLRYVWIERLYEMRATRVHCNLQMDLINSNPLGRNIN